jgi:predicted amidohydrolase YtcJ
MNARDLSRMSRRKFLASLGGLCAWVITGCGRRQREATAVPTKSKPTAIHVLSPTPAAQPTPVPSATPVSAETAADMALINGKVITVSPADAIVQAVTIRNGLIQAVGSSDELASRIGPSTQVMDLKGQTVTPGLIDPHNHLQVMGLMGTYFLPFIPPEVKTIQDLQTKLAEIAAQTPKGEWIKGYYLAVSEGRVPNRQDLDPVSPDHPVWLMQQGGHFGAANSVALKIAGITAKTPNPTGGIIERDASGEPTGVFYNHRAMDLLRQYIPQWTAETTRDNIISTQPLFAACGVTTFQDNNVRGTDSIGLYLDIGKQGKMLLRGSVYYTLEWPKDLDRALTQLEHYEDPFMRLAGFKFLIDGQAPTAYCHEPHNGTSWNMSTWEPGSFKQAVRALHETGLQICVHCAGDAAADLTLDAYEEAMKASPRSDPRHRIEHAVLTTPDATKRMRDLGVVVSTQPQFIRVGGDTWVKLFGEERAKRAMVTREWLDNGVHVALGSDAPTTPWYTPQMTLWGALTRVSLSGKEIGPEQRLTIQEALRAHTMGGAYAGHEEAIKGSIEVGKLADLVVWKEDPYTATVQRLPQIAVATTIVGGKVIYQG